MGNDVVSPGAHTGRILVGVLIIAAGLIMLADRAGLAGVHVSGRYWPLFLVAFGLVRLIDPPAGRGRRSRWPGMWFIYIGLWGAVNESHVFGLTYGTSWPLLIVGAGVGMIWRALEHHERPQVRES